MSTETILPIDRQSVANLSQTKQEPEWMTELRVKGLELAGQLELPRLEKTRIDRWNLSTYGEHVQSKPIGSLQELAHVAQELLAEGNPENVLVQRNSGIVYGAISQQLADQGVIFTDLETALQVHGNLIQTYFMKAVQPDENRLTALHTALWNGGVFLYIPRNLKVEVPLQALFLSDDVNATFSPHVLVVAEENSSVTYVENFVSAASGELVSNSIVEVFVKQGATVRFASVHNLEEQVTDVVYRRAVIEKDGRVEWIIGELNAGNVLSDTTSVLQGSGSSSDAKGICVGKNDQKLNLTTRAIHIGKRTFSNMVTRAVMKDSSTAIINGVTKIEKGATGANGQQTEKVLMMSPKARGDANPILLIDEDDVKCGHAASVGQVNPEQVHYLMSRGITKKEAHRLIVYGFLAPVVSQIPIAKLEEQLQRLVERKLEQ